MKLFLAFLIGVAGGAVGGLVAAKVIESKARAAVAGSPVSKLAKIFGL